MPKTITKLKSDLGRKVSTINKIPGGVDGLIEEAATNVLNYIRIPQTRKRVDVTLLDANYQYGFTAPEHILRIVDIFPTDATRLVDRSRYLFTNVSTTDFERYKDGNTYSYTSYDGTPSLLISSNYMGDNTSYTIDYYSSAIFKAANATFSDTITSDSDEIMIDNEAYNILLYEAAYLASQEVQGDRGGFNNVFFQNQLWLPPKGLVPRYRSKYPSEDLPISNTYMTM